MRLPTRLALVGVADLALTLAAVGLLTYQLVRVSGRQDVDQALRRELDGVIAGLPGELPAAAELPEGAAPSLADLEAAADRYLALNPGSARHLAVIEVDGHRSYTNEGPPELVDLVRTGRLPAGEPGRLRTVDTTAGPARPCGSRSWTETCRGHARRRAHATPAGSTPRERLRPSHPARARHGEQPRTPTVDGLGIANVAPGREGAGLA